MASFGRITRPSLYQANLLAYDFGGFQFSGSENNDQILPFPETEYEPTLNPGKKTFSGEIRGFLGLHGAHDRDPGAFGDKVEGYPMKSTFLIYDDAEVQKDMVIVDRLASSNAGVAFAGHYIQNTVIAKAFINAFLQVHLHGNSMFNWFLKFQVRPPSFDDDVYYQQHSDTDRILLADFDTTNGHYVISDDGISNVVVGDAFVIDEFSPHNSKVLMFDLNPTGLGNPKPFVRFSFDSPTDLDFYRFLSFRITQVYHPDTNPTSSLRAFEVVLAWTGGSVTFQSQDIGGHLNFPIKGAPPLGVGIPFQVKNAMRSYIVRLTNIPDVDVDFSSIVSVTIQFPFAFNGFEHTIIAVDDVEFYNYF